MTTASVSDLAFPTTTLLAGLASALLLFVSIGVIYLSTVEWRDRRRRRSTEGRPRS
ncbi:hypothetical protein [Synechococcus sp. CCY 0621]|uniref:hypothetical protein n=1 Tax=Synechococcus sp. CCY 0621 TaxID=2815603 RepID=UPI001C236AB3|nr:hypothetical protein [Synechococcus sp. CCY 0621]